MRLLVVGANGLLGSRVVAAAEARDWQAAGTYYSGAPAFDINLYQLDIRKDDRFASLLDALDPEWVVNAAAMTDVDACERNPATAQEVNGHAPGRLASKCRDRDVGFVHVSTDYVFDGDADCPYQEDADPGPIQTYGESKLAGERAVRAAHGEALVLRLSFVYGLHAGSGDLTGFPAWVSDELASGGEVSLFADQYVTPTRAGQAAATALDLVEAGAVGTFHVASRSCVTPYAFGRAIRDRLPTRPGTVNRGSVDDVERPAPRPRYTCLDVSKIEAELKRDQPTLEADLNAIAGAF